jgi:hypothetical protein
VAGRDKPYKITNTDSRYGRDYLFSSESTAFSPIIFNEEDNCWVVDDVDQGKFLHDTMTPDVVNEHVNETLRELMLEDVEVFVVEKLYIRDRGFPEWSVQCNNRRKIHVGILDDDDVDQKFSGAIAMLDGKQQYVRCLGKLIIKRCIMAYVNKVLFDVLYQHLVTQFSLWCYTRLVFLSYIC